MEKVGAYTQRTTAQGEWRAGNPATNVRATPMLADYFNMLQRELLNVLSAADVSPDELVFTQLADSVAAISANYTRELTDSDDLDTQTSPGAFFWDGTVPAHAPTSDVQQAMRVATAGPAVSQMVMSAQSLSIRWYDGATWSDWASVDASANPDTIARRDHAGALAVATPTSARHAVPLDYFNANVRTDAFQSPSPHHAAIKKTGAQTVAVRAGTDVMVNGILVPFLTDTNITVPTFTAGEDYSVWVKPSGDAVAVLDPYENPASAPVQNAVKIGGFHYGATPHNATVVSGSFNTTGDGIQDGMIWTQADVDLIAGINAHSIWDLHYRPSCDPRGMFCVNINGIPMYWQDIYFSNIDHLTYGTSRYNQAPMSGTVDPLVPPSNGGNGTTDRYTSANAWDMFEIARWHGKRFLTYRESTLAAWGVTEQQSLGGASSTIPATKREPGYTSKWGGEQQTGHLYTWGAPIFGSGTGWSSATGRGSYYGSVRIALLRGDRTAAGHSGSRCANWSYGPWYSSWGVALFAACDHLTPVARAEAS